MLSEKADETYFAGDDDQAIHRWAGVDVERFKLLSVDQQVLAQSYRLPAPVFDLSQDIVKRIHGRIPKEYRPTEEAGTVGFHYDYDGLPLEAGSWSLMARTNGYAATWADNLRNDLFYYSLKGVPSVDEGLAQGIGTWRALQEGHAQPLSVIQALYKRFSVYGTGGALRRGAKGLLEAADPQAMYDATELRAHYGLLLPLETPATSALPMSVEERGYISALERRGEDITRPPRIKVSTIHAMKGGEDDNIGLYLGSTKRIRMSPYQDDEHRIFYVGATRARKNLHIIEGKWRDRYAI